MLSKWIVDASVNRLGEELLVMKVDHSCEIWNSLEPEAMGRLGLLKSQPNDIIGWVISDRPNLERFICDHNEKLGLKSPPEYVEKYTCVWHMFPLDLPNVSSRANLPGCLSMK